MKYRFAESLVNDLINEHPSGTEDLTAQELDLCCKIQGDEGMEWYEWYRYLAYRTEDYNILIGDDGDCVISDNKAKKHYYLPVEGQIDQSDLELSEVVGGWS